MSFARYARKLVGLVLLGFCLTAPLTPAHAYVNQLDGTVLPEGSVLQACLDRAGSGESTPGALDAVVDAAILPEAYRPVLDASSGHYRVTFVDIGEGAGYRNSFGWYWIGEDVSDGTNLHTIFGCRTYATCNCPCATTRTITIDFDLETGFAAGRPIGFWLRTPELLTGGNEGGSFSSSGCGFNTGCDPTTPNQRDSCGGRLDTNNRIYFTSQSLNDDGEFVHFLVYESATRTNTYYFGFEDLYRGGDNDFEDMLTTATGLVPLCDPQPETCDNSDQDCDGMVDEGIERACSTTCGSGIEICSAGSFGPCSAATPTIETCDNTDEDCDSSIDEGLSRTCSNDCGSGTEICIEGTFAGCSAPSPSIETCNNSDDDCDGTTDESITRTCATSCGSGIETCMAGTFMGCTAPAPSVETCDNRDEDCDGLTDEGISQACSSACGSGIETCIAGTFVGCTAPTGTTESCNNIDDDCDGMTDEGITRACSSPCGVGTETCVAGSFAGCTAPEASSEICNNIDDDCNGVIDDGNPGGGDWCQPNPDGSFDTASAPVTGADERCVPGQVQCVAGSLLCLGASSTTREVCNCEDDDCDGIVDEDPDGTFCPGGACISCQCASPCADNEFPCPPGRECDRSLADEEVIGYCVPGMCSDVMCTDEQRCNPDTGMCEDLCADVTCESGLACVRGRCIENNCYGRGCETGQRCTMGMCEPDPCADTACPDGAFCREGECIATCTLDCPAGEQCIEDQCEPAPCAGSCTNGETCIEDACVPNTCDPPCGSERLCAGDTCIDDPCRSIRCEAGSSCVGEGQCIRDELVTPAAPEYAIASGGCACTTAPKSTPSTPAAWICLVFGLLGLLRLRRRQRAASYILLGALLLSVSGCSVDAFCIRDCPDQARDAGPPDAQRPDVTLDGCVASEEVCDSVDNDCDGLVDEDFNLSSNLAHCGGCGIECILPFAFPSCVDGACAIDRCEVGHHDLNTNPTDGCEYECPPSGAELCDGLDNDCDGISDEGFDLATDLANCGSCANTCNIPNATATCIDSACQLTDCNTGFIDLNTDPVDGCEYRCTPTGTEACNRVDDDCDNRIDETFDLTTDSANCGECGRACSFVNAVGACNVDSTGAAICIIASCATGFHDIDGDPATGCEYACTPSGSADTCDGIDDDCDGRIDETEPMVGTACGSDVGACEFGIYSCQRGSILCVGDRSAQPESCNGVDDDCDGPIDESTSLTPIPGVGERCGATNIGVCEFGTTVCNGGTLECDGSFVGPGIESCNGLDDDCNGATDDGLTPPASASLASCAETDGVCAGRTATCRGSAGWACDFPANYQAIESICDSFDNDCDGTPDEGCLFATASDTRIDTGDSTSSDNSLAPTILGDGSNRIWAVWMDLRGSGDARIYYNRSTDNGSSWLSSATRLNDASQAAMRPVMGLATPDDVSVLWSDFRPGSYRRIYGAFSNNWGDSFATNAHVNSSGTSASRDSFNVEVATDGTHVHAVYETFISNRSRHIFYTRSTNGGATWRTPVQLSTPTTSTFVASVPQVVATNNYVYVLWRDNRGGSSDLYLRRSTDGGANFVTGEIRIDVGDVAGGNSSFSADLAAESNNVYVVWVDDRNMGAFDIWSNRSQDHGATWLSSAQELGPDAFANDSMEPHVVAIAGGTAVASWIDYRSGFADILSVRSADAGTTWSTTERLDTGTSPGAAGSFDLSIGQASNLVVAAWADDRSGYLDIYANYSLDGGQSWQPNDVRLDTSALGTSDSEHPQVYVNPTSAHVLWVDHRLGAGCPSSRRTSTECANGDIYYQALR